MTKFQPTLPAEEPFSDAELAFLDESPPGLFPENQDSNFGFIIRKIFSDLIQELINQQNTIYAEHFVDSSTQFLSEWELQVGLPVAPTGLSTQQRQNLILNKIRVGPFTRARRDAIVKSFVQATLGDAAQLTPSGLALTGAGIPLYSGLSSVVGAYTITESISTFHFTITVATGVTVDTVALTRELNRVIPAGFSFNIVSGSQTFKSSGDSGVGANTQSVQVQSVLTSGDTGHAAESAVIAPASFVGSEAGHGTDSAMIGFGSGVFGSGAFGGVEKVTGVYRASLNAISAPSTLEQVILRVRARKHNLADTGVVLVQLYSGATLIEEYMITLTDAFTTYEHVVRNAGLISNWAALEVRIQGQVTNTGGSLTPDVSDVELQAAI